MNSILSSGIRSLGSLGFWALAAGLLGAAEPNLAAPGKAPQREAFRRVQVEEFETLRAKPEAVVVDVRTADEFAAGHLPKAGHVDVMSPDFKANVTGLDRSKLYLVNCAAGVRSARACQTFAKLGFTNVVNLEGGFNAWSKANPALVSKEPAVALPKAGAAKP